MALIVIKTHGSESRRQEKKQATTTRSILHAWPCQPFTVTFLQLLNRFKLHLWLLHNLGRKSINLGSLKVATIPRFSMPDS